MIHGTATIRRDTDATSIEIAGRHLTSNGPVNLGAGIAITLRMSADHRGWAVQQVDIRLRLTGADETMRIERALAEIAERTPMTLTMKGGTLSEPSQA